jgi:hypothetical protein
MAQMMQDPHMQRMMQSVLSNPDMLQARPEPCPPVYLLSRQLRTVVRRYRWCVER